MRTIKPSGKTVLIFALALVTGVNSACQSTGGAASTQNPTTLAGARQTDEITRDALLKALDDERKAEATYAAIIAEYGEIRPFSNVIHAEVRHQQLLMQLLEEYGVAAPPNPYDPATQFVPATLQEACILGMKAEQDNIAMYDRLIPRVEQADIRSAFETLRGASADRHLPAFERCAHRGNGPGRGRQG